MTGDFPPTPEFTDITFSVNTGPCINFNAPGDIVLSIHGTEGELVTISQDGTVKIIKEGSAPEAAQMFWKCISLCYQGIIQERDALKLQVEELKEEIMSLEEDIDARNEFEVKAGWNTN